MNSFGKFLLTVICIIYVLSPLDMCLGPIDDILVIVLTQAAKKGSDEIFDND